MNSKTSLAEQIECLYKEQCSSWSEFKEAVLALKIVQRRQVLLSTGDEVTIQFNPRRAASTLAKIDQASIAARPCFLCPKNLPQGQNGLLWHDYLVLCNPRPILNNHFTVSYREHRLQELPVEDFLSLANDLGGKYTVFFNGAKSGASAPDHLHFQICPTTELPLMRKVVTNTIDDSVAVYGTRYKLIVLESLQETVIKLEQMLKIGDFAENGFINVLATKVDGRFFVVVALRAAHRPSCYFNEDQSSQIKVSPACVEIAGLLVTAREQDFNNLNADNIFQIYQDVIASI